MRPGFRIGKTSCRKLTLLDAMVMVAASAISIYLSKLHHEDLIGANGDQWRGNLALWSGTWLLAYAGGIKGWTVCWLVPVSWAFLLIRLRQPRPRLRRLLQQPGMADPSGPADGIHRSPVRESEHPGPFTSHWYVGYRLNGLGLSRVAWRWPVHGYSWR